jgi:O-antigen ligase
VQLFQKGIDGIAADPEGRGPGTAGLVATKLSNGLLTENYYLQIGYEVGIAGLLMFIGLLVVVLRQLWTLRQSFLAQTLLASFVGLAFMNLLLHTWANEAVAASWWLLTGILLWQKTVRAKEL